MLALSQALSQPLYRDLHIFNLIINSNIVTRKMEFDFLLLAVSLRSMSLISAMTQTNHPCHFLAGLSITQNRVGVSGVAGSVTVSELRDPILLEGKGSCTPGTGEAMARQHCWKAFSDSRRYISIWLP